MDVKSHKFYLLLIALTILFNSVSAYASDSVKAQENVYKVLKVIDGDTLYLDFNYDGKIQRDERVRLNGIDSFEVKPTDGLKWQMTNYHLTEQEALGLGYFGKEFAKNKLLNKDVHAVYSADVQRCSRGRHLMSVYYKDNKDAQNYKNYEEEILKAGLAVIYEPSNLTPQLKKYENLSEVYKNAKKTRKLNLVILNKHNNKYHNPHCEYIQNGSDAELINLPKFNHKYKPAGCCYPQKQKNRTYKYSKKPGKFDAEENNMELYFLSPLKQKRPENKCKSEACKTLLYYIDHAEKSIDFAIYGIESQDKIFNALMNAQKRGVKVRWVTDKTNSNENIFADTYSLMHKIPSNSDDYKYHLKESKNNPKLEFPYSAIMHNKFFIFDEKTVFTGSANISSYGLTGYNSNVSIVIKSPEIAALYKKEFEQMYSGAFHTDKIPAKNNENIKLHNAEVSVYFSPGSKTISEKIIPVIKEAENYIFIPVFYLTHPAVYDELINARKRGVDVKIIIDKSCVDGKYADIDRLMQNNIDVKVENWSGKMHMKSIIIDNKILAAGSMNFTRQGELFNDENCIIIKNSPVLVNAYKQHFLKLWKTLREYKG